MSSFDDPLLTGGLGAGGFPLSGGFDSATVAGMRLQKARAAMDAGDPRQAMVEAEELLDEHPDHVGALQLSGEAALRMGDGAMAVAAFDAVIRRHPDADGALRLLAEARFMALDAPGAQADLDTCLARHPDDPLVWRLAAAMARRADPPRPDDARAADERLRTLDPTQPPLREDEPDAAWEDRLQHAMAGLPPEVRDFYRDMPIHWHEVASWSLLADSQPTATPFHPALLDLPPVHEGDDDLPTAVHLFRVNLRARGDRPEDRQERLARALYDLASAWVEPDDED